MGNEPTIADFVFVNWNRIGGFVTAGSESEAEIKKYKNYERWHEALCNTPAVKKVLKDQEEAIGKH